MLAKEEEGHGASSCAKHECVCVQSDVALARRDTRDKPYVCACPHVRAQRMRQGLQGLGLQL